MCDYIHGEPTTLSLETLKPEEMPCLGNPTYFCADIDKCPHARAPVAGGAAKIARLCVAHVQFCKHCHKAFCPGCCAIHETHYCPQRIPQATVADAVERAMGLMGL